MYDDYLSIQEAAKRCPGRPHMSTLWRWCRRGVKTAIGKRVYLKHYRVGRSMYIRPADLEEFFGRVAEADLEYWKREQEYTPPPPPKQKTQRNEGHERAMEKLRRMGVVDAPP